MTNSLSQWGGSFQPTFFDLVGIGVIPGARLLSFGSTVSSLDSSDGEVMFNESILGFPTELDGDTVYLVSSSASDTNDYLVEGVDDNGAFQSATVTANGSTPVEVSGSWDHVQRCVAKATANAGTVYVSTDSGAVPTTDGDQIQTVMLAGTSYAVNPLLVCPNNRTILVKRFSFSIDTKDAAVIRIFANREGNYIQNFKFYASANQFDQAFDAPLKLLPKDRFRVSIQLSQSTGTNATFGMNGAVLTGAISE